MEGPPMGDSRRFDLFADLVAKRFSRAKGLRVADVAGGTGGLQVALRARGFGDVVTFDRCRASDRARGVVAYVNGWFDHRLEASFDLVVGMHPDEGSDHLVRYALRNRVPFVLCPCCVKPSAVPFAGPRDFRTWARHLGRMASAGGFAVESALLPMRGMSEVLIGVPA